jgi:preprotein translocase subunit SecD
MNSRWYFSTLIIILILFGVCQKQISVPNQEIVLEFIDNKVTSDEVQEAIAIVKNQLQSLGVDEIEVQEEADGRLRITYYSDVNVTSIKKIFSERENLELGYASYNQDEEDTRFPSDKNSNSYHIDVYEIQNGADADFGLDGKYVLELKHEYDRFSNPNVYLSTTKIEVSDSNEIPKVTYKVRRNIAIAIDDNSRHVPDVRAGPVS